MARKSKVEKKAHNRPMCGHGDGVSCDWSRRGTDGVCFRDINDGVGMVQIQTISGKEVVLVGRGREPLWLDREGAEKLLVALRDVLDGS